MNSDTKQRLESVKQLFDENCISHCLIGAGALMAHGYPRSTFDIDLLTTEVAVLRDDFWDQVRSSAKVRVYRGDFNDPLVGVVRIGDWDQDEDGDEISTSIQIDIVLVRGDWVPPILERSVQRGTIAGVELPIVNASDLVLLKLYAGGTRDRSDIQALLEGPKGNDIRDEVNLRINEMPSEAVALWKKLTTSRD